jgi:hypothetical protein
MAAMAMPGVARRRLDDGLAGVEVSLLLRGLDHAAGDAVLDRAERVLALHLGEDADPGVRRQHADVHEGVLPIMSSTFS